MRIVFIFFFLIIVFCNYSYSQNSTKNITINKSDTLIDRAMPPDDRQIVIKPGTTKTKSSVSMDTLFNVYSYRKMNIQAQRKNPIIINKKSTINISRKD